MNLATFFQQLANAASLGSLYSLIAIGYTMVYGILRLINFAHGDVFMLGSYGAFYLIAAAIMPWWVALIVAIALTALFGMGLERVAYRPLRDSPRISVMISAIGASFLLESLGVVIFGGRPKSFPSIPLFDTVVNFGSVSVLSVSLFIPVITAIMLVVLLYVVHRTKTGMAMRAVSTDVEASRLMAINVNWVISITFGIGSALAGLGGIMWAAKYPQLNPLMGIMPSLKCFIAAVIGGIGDIGGAVLGGFLLGFIEIMVAAFLPQLTGYRDAFSFVLLILVLLIKPAGLLGKRLSVKV